MSTTPIILPSELFIWYRGNKTKNDINSTVFVIPVEKGSKRYDTVTKWVGSTWHTSIVKCEPQRGFKIKDVVDRYQTDNKLIEIWIPNVGVVQIDMFNFFQVLKALNSMRVFFDEALLVYDGKTLLIAEGKEIVYSNYTYSDYSKKLSEKKQSWKVYLELDRYWIKNYFLRNTTDYLGAKIKVSRTEWTLIGHTLRNQNSYNRQVTLTLKDDKGETKEIVIDSYSKVTIKWLAIDSNTKEDILIKEVRSWSITPEILFKYVQREII